MATQHDELRARIAELREMDLDGLRRRIELLTARTTLEDAADKIAEDTDTDSSVVLLVMHAVWTERVDAEMSGDLAAEVDPDAFAAAVERDTRAALIAIGNGEVVFDSPYHTSILKRMIQLGSTGAVIKPTREVFSTLHQMIMQQRPLGGCA